MASMVRSIQRNIRRNKTELPYFKKLKKLFGTELTDKIRKKEKGGKR